jgi:hypothetical protein
VHEQFPPVLLETKQLPTQLTILKAGSPWFSSGPSANDPSPLRPSRKSFRTNSVNQRPEEYGRLSHDYLAIGFAGSISLAIMEEPLFFPASVAEKLASARPCRPGNQDCASKMNAGTKVNFARSHRSSSRTLWPALASTGVRCGAF